MQKLFLLLLLLPALLANSQTNAAWQQTSGPEGGYVFDLARTSSTIYAASDNGIWVSADEGQSWGPLNQTLNDLRILSMYVAGDEILALAVNFLDAYDNEALFLRSIDAGLTWTKVPIGNDPPYISLSNSNTNMRIWRDGNLIWIQSSGALFKSDNNGANWTKISIAGNPYLSSLAVSGNKALAYSSYNRYTSDDWGDNWVQTTDSSYTVDLFSDGDLLIRLRYDSIFVSSDFGQNWQGTITDFYTLDGLFRLADGSFAMINGVLYSSADGLNWQLLSQSGGQGISATDAVESGGSFVLGGLSGIYRSTQNNTQFESANKGFKGSRIYALEARTDGKLFASVTYAGLWSSTNNGLSWEKAPDPKTTYNSVVLLELYARGDTLWGIGGNDSLYQLVGNANTWTKVLDVDAWFGGESFMRFFGNNIYLVEDAQIRRSQDGGGTWKTLATSQQGGDGLRDIAEFDNYLFFTTNNGLVFRSGNDGLSWQQVYDFWSPGAHRFNKLGVSGGRLIIWSEYESFYSIDQGITWQNLNMSGLPVDNWGDVNFEPLEIKYLQNVIVCAFPYTGVWLSFDQGNNWEPLNNGLSTKRARRLSTRGGSIFMGGSCTGVWQLDANFEIYSGQVYNDLNQNGQKDNGEPPLKNILLSAEPLGSYTASDAAGSFALVAATMLDSIRVTLPNQYSSVLPLARLANQTGGGYDFGIHFTEDIVDLSLDIANWSPFRPGFDNQLTLTVSNIGNETVANALVQLALPGELTVLYTEPFGAATILNDTLRWQIATLAPFESTSLTVHVVLDATTAIGHILSFDGQVSTDNDIDLTNNQVSIREPVVGSYDPNDKSAAAYITPEALAAGKPIEYTIRFENTGNFFAEKVVVRDVLEANVNPATFKFISASHPCVWKMKQDGTVEFTFNQIYLLPNETGFVRFSVEGDRDLALNDLITNTAAIFFDFNAPIITNTVQTKVQNTLSSPDLAQTGFELQLWPNPASTYLTLKMPEASLDQAAQLALFDQTGKRILVRKDLSGQMTLDLSALSAGAYKLLLYGKTGRVLAREKVVVLR